MSDRVSSARASARTVLDCSRPSNSALPRADVLLVTWTVDEGHALSRVLTPGKDSHDDRQRKDLSADSTSTDPNSSLRTGCREPVGCTGCRF